MNTTTKMTEKEMNTYENLLWMLDKSADANDSRAYKYWGSKVDMFVDTMCDKYEFLNNREDVEDHIYGAPVGSMSGYCSNLVTPGLGN